MKRSEIIDTISLLADNATLPEADRARAKEAERAMRAATIPDTRVYRIVVWVLGIVAVMTVAGGIGLEFMPWDAELPQAVVSIGSAAVGALAGLLAPSPAGGADDA